MPLIEKSSYQAPWAMRNGHIATVFTALFRGAARPVYRRLTIPTPDGDFLDLDLDLDSNPALDRNVFDGGSYHIPNESLRSKRVVILLHGLEGSTEAHYMRAMTVAIREQLDCPTIGFNFRGCSGRPNQKSRSYHSGATEDLQVVVEWVEQQFPGSEIALVGFSLGGNLMLKYLGEGLRRDAVVGGVAISVPCDLAGSSEVLSDPLNQMLYMRRFIKRLVNKLEDKNRTLGTDFDIAAFREMKTFEEFDGAYTAPIHGFGDAENYWKVNSSRQFLHQIEVPTLLVNALDDPFMSESCFPRDIARESRFFYLETPRHGGHVGFLQSIYDRFSCWHETRAVEFLRQHVFIS